MCTCICNYSRDGNRNNHLSNFRDGNVRNGCDVYAVEINIVRRERERECVCIHAHICAHNVLKYTFPHARAYMWDAVNSTILKEI